MPDESQTLPEFESLYAALKYGFDEIQQESDPFRRLAWLIECQEVYFQQTGRRSRLPDLLGLPSSEPLLGDWENVLRNYHELRCEPDFPRRLIREGLTPATRREFLAVLGEVEKNDSEFWIAFNEEQVCDEIEYWLGFETAQLTARRPVSGVVVALDELNQARNRLNDPNVTRGDILGQVTQAFVQAETLLRQLFAFYGTTFYGANYVEEMISQYEEERNIPSIDTEVRQQMSSESGWLQAYLRGKWRLDFGNYCRLLHRLDCWVWKSIYEPRDDAESERGLKFQEIFERDRLFPGQQEAGNSVYVPVKEGNAVTLKEVPISDGFTSPFVATLQNLNPLRPLYVHEDDPSFVHPGNLENILDGARKILDTFLKLLSDAQETIFPAVVLVRRLVQIEPDMVRIDYVPETGPPLNCIRVAKPDLPSEVDVTQLLGQEAFLYVRNGQGGMVSVLLLYPVE